MGIVMTSSGIGTILGPALGGAFYQFAGYAAPFLAVALAGTLLGMLLWFSWMPETGGETGGENEGSRPAPGLRQLLQNRDVKGDVIPRRATWPAVLGLRPPRYCR